MDFTKEIMDTQGHGNYIQLDESLAPPMWLSFIRNPSDSGKIHSNVRERYNNGKLL